MPTLNFANGATVFIRGDRYVGPATVRGISNNGTDAVRLHVRTADGRKLNYNLSDLLSGFVLRGGAPDGNGAGAITIDPTPDEPKVDEVELEFGDIVRVNGSRYQDEGIVLAVWEEPSEETREKGVRQRPDQSYPQVEVRTSTGKDIHYNGDDIAQGKIAFVRKPDDSDYAAYAHGTTKAVPHPSGLLVPYA